MQASRISRKGQVVIPARLRKKIWTKEREAVFIDRTTDIIKPERNLPTLRLGKADIYREEVRKK